MKATMQAVLLSTFACAFLFSSVTAFADGDGECEKDPPYAKAALKRAKETESAGKSIQALLLYEKIWFCVDKNGTKEVEAGKKRILGKFARAQEKKGFIHAGEGYRNHVEDAHCAGLDKKRRDEYGHYLENYELNELKGPDDECEGSNRVEFNESSGAFEILWLAHEYAEADGVLMKGVRAKPKDLRIVKFAVEHFSPGDANPPQPPFVKGGSSNVKVRSSKKDNGGYTPDPANSPELRRITAQNTEDLLVAEDKSFSDKTITLSVTDPMAGLSPANRSLKLMGDARDWASLADKQMTDKVLARAKKRGGDVLETDKKSPSHVSLSEALSFYEFAGDDAAVRNVKAAADKRGEQSASKGEVREAAYYFGISGNKKRADELSGDVKRGYDKKTPAKDIMKGDKDKKQFKKEADDLEKELGM